MLMPASDVLRPNKRGRMLRGSILVVAMVGLCPGAYADRIENGTAVFSALDKVTATTQPLDVPLGETKQFGALKVTPRACYSRPSTEQPKTTAFVEVDEIQLDGRKSASLRAGCLPKARASTPSSIPSSTCGSGAARAPSDQWRQGSRNRSRERNRGVNRRRASGRARAAPSRPALDPHAVVPARVVPAGTAGAPRLL